MGGHRSRILLIIILVSMTICATHQTTSSNARTFSKPENDLPFRKYDDYGVNVTELEELAWELVEEIFINVLVQVMDSFISILPGFGDILTTEDMPYLIMLIILMGGAVACGAYKISSGGGKV